MRGNEIGDQVLLLARFLAEAFEHLLEPVIGAHARLHHFGKYVFLGVLGRNLEITADVMLHQFLHVFRRSHGKVIAQTGADQDLLHALDVARLAVKLNQRRMIGIEVLADAGINTGQFAAGFFYAFRLAGHAIHIGRRPAEVGNDAGKAVDLVANLLDLVQDGRL